MSALSVEGVGVGFQKEGDELKSASAGAEVGKHSPLPTGQSREGDSPQVSAASPTETLTPSPRLVCQAHSTISSANRPWELPEHSKQLSSLRRSPFKNSLMEKNHLMILWGSRVAQVVKNPPANAET